MNTLHINSNVEHDFRLQFDDEQDISYTMYIVQRYVFTIVCRAMTRVVYTMYNCTWCLCTYIKSFANLVHSM